MCVVVVQGKSSQLPKAAKRASRATVNASTKTKEAVSRGNGRGRSRGGAGAGRGRSGGKGKFKNAPSVDAHDSDGSGWVFFPPRTLAEKYSFTHTHTYAEKNARPRC